MQRYWVKIALGAAAVFALGMGLIALARSSLAEIKSLAHSNRPIGVPLALLPFKVDGSDLGTIRRFDLLRSSPDDVSGIRFTVQLRDSASLRSVRDCVLTAQDPGDSPHRGVFGCSRPSDSAAPRLEQIGEVRFEPGGVVRAVFAPAEHAGNRAARENASLRAQLAGLEAQGLADSAARVSIRADSTQALIEVRGDSGAPLVRIQADSHGARMRIRDRSGKEIFRLNADPGGASLSVLGDSATTGH